MMLRASMMRGALFAGLCCWWGGAVSRAEGPADSWVTTWASAQTAPYGTETLPAGAFEEATLREVVHLSVGGPRLRLKLTNLFGNGPLEVRSVHIALRPRSVGLGAIDPATDRVLAFRGRPAVMVPAGAEYLSDPIGFVTAPLSDLVVTMVVGSSSGNATVHAGAHATAFLAAGDHAAEAQLREPQTFTRWYFLAGVEVAGDVRNRGSVIAYGDSITDGHGSTTDQNDRWPDVLARRLNTGASALHLGVVNEGIGGNRILQEGIGPSATARFDRDVLAQSGIRTVILLEGINDIGGLDRVAEHPAEVHQALVNDLESAMQQLAAQAHTHGIRVLGATLTAFVGSDYYHPSAATEADRQALNQWIRSAGVFDGVIDFDAVTRDPAHPDRLLPAVDSGDHLHPGPAGYLRMGDAVPLGLLLR